MNEHPNQALINEIEQVFVTLWDENPEFREACTRAAGPARYIAAVRIHDAAPEGSLIKNAGIAAIVQRLRFVLRRYGIKPPPEGPALGGE